MIDAQPGDGWVVPTAVSWALLSDPSASDAALAAAEPLWAGRGGPWLRAARYGPGDERSARAARVCSGAGDAARRRSGEPASLPGSATVYADRYGHRGPV